MFKIKHYSDHISKLTIVIVICKFIGLLVRLGNYMHVVKLMDNNFSCSLFHAYRHNIKRIILASILSVAISLPAWADSSAGWVTAPRLPTLKSPNDITAVAFQNTSDIPTRPTYVSFGTVLAPNAMYKFTGCVATMGKNTQIPIQVDPKTYYANGSVQFALVTAKLPSLSSDSINPVLVKRRINTALYNQEKNNHVNIDHDLRKNNIKIVFTFENNINTKITKEYDLLDMYEADVKGNLKPDYWRRGPLATEIRIQRHVLSSLRLVVDITAYANDTLSADVQFNNDVAMSRPGGKLVYSVRITNHGETIYKHENINQFQYQTWHVLWRSSGWQSINVIHDINQLIGLGALPNYQTRYGVPNHLLLSEFKSLKSKWWGMPLSGNGVTMYMPMTGGRPDIGPLTEANAIWLITQDPVAAAYALGQSDASGAIPWHFYLPKEGHYLTTLDYPNFWADPRGGPYSGTTGLTQPYSFSSGWHPDAAHIPSLNYVPYLLTGRRYYLDQLNAEALYVILGQWPSPRNGGQGLLVGPGAQTRGAAWSLREVAYAAYANPRNSYYGRYFRLILRNNIKYLEKEIPIWTREQGETYGYILGSYGHTGVLPPWQQDFLATTMATIARIGIPGAKKILNWQLHFLAGSLHPHKNWNPHDGIAYALKVYDPHTKTRYKTWAEILKGTQYIEGDNGDGWKHSRGYYGMVRMAALASIYNITNSREALSAYRWVAESGAPAVSRNARAQHPQYWIVPRVH